jgi:hypothetical protein
LATVSYVPIRLALFISSALLSYLILSNSCNAAPKKLLGKTVSVKISMTITYSNILGRIYSSRLNNVTPTPDAVHQASQTPRGSSTPYAMDTIEAEHFGIDAGERRDYVRLDSAKVNITRHSKAATWFKLVGVPLNNGTPDYPNGDVVQTVER